MEQSKSVNLNTRRVYCIYRLLPCVYPLEHYVGLQEYLTVLWGERKKKIS